MILNDRATSYTYDGINRLRLADGLDAAGKQMKEQISYDLNGNILSLNRTMGGVEIDNLAYSYKPNSNQLQAVTDNITAYNGLGYNDVNKKTDDFKYDNNGSMTSDLDKSLALTYNRLNLVQTAQINSSKQVYLYNTQGNKMAQKVDGQNKAYLFGSEYMNGELIRMQTAEGFVSKNLNWKDGSTDKKYPYSFSVSDHLGNIRVVVDEQGQVQQKNEYTAFGVVQSTDPSKNKYLFNNKELQTGTNYLDYGARMYQPELGRWNVVDPLAVKNPSWTPYHYTKNNPISRIDPDGMDDIYYNFKGEKSKTVERSWLFELFAGGDRNYINDNKGKSFKLTDQALGVVTGGGFKGFESNWETSNGKIGFNSLLKNATEPKGSENAFSYTFRESKDGGNLDQKKNLDPNKIYGASGKAMNKNEAGNYVWGAALAKFGFSTSDAVNLANGGTMYLETISRPNREGRGWGLRDIGNRLSRARFDEPDEIDAIVEGTVKIIGFKLDK
jgi:RHS repeat-associated protein